MDRKGNCLVLGGGGFIGSHLCEDLLKYNYKVTVFDKINFSKKNLVSFIDNIEIIEGDFTNELDIAEALKGKDYVFHLVSTTLPESSNKNPVYDVETNLVSTLKLLEECRISKIKKLIFISSGGTIYGIPSKIPIKEDHPKHPICSYGIVKKTIEDYLYMFNSLYDLNYNIFRLSNPYGERQNPYGSQGVITVFLKKIFDGDKIEIWGDGNVVRDYIYIKDITNVLINSLSINSENKIFNLSSGQGFSLNEIINLIKEVVNKEINIRYTEARKVDVPVNILDNTLIKQVFKWKPEINIKEGISRTYKYIIHNT